MNTVEHNLSDHICEKICICGHPCWEHHSPNETCPGNCCMNKECDDNPCIGFIEKEN